MLSFGSSATIIVEPRSVSSEFSLIDLRGNFKYKGIVYTAISGLECPLGGSKIG